MYYKNCARTTSLLFDGIMRKNEKMVGGVASVGIFYYICMKKKVYEINVCNYFILTCRC